MRAMVLERHAAISERPLVPRDLPVPEPAAGEIQLKVHGCAICRTDLHVIEGELPTHELPVVPGHQLVGTVTALGRGCQGLHPIGSRVGVAWLRSTDGTCRFCRSGRENLCEQATFTGYDANGGYAEYAVAREDFVYRLPEGFSDAEAAPLLCSGIIGYRSLQRVEVPPGGRLGLWGFGASAHVIIQLARYRGAEVFVVTREARHRELARLLGATWVGSSGERPPVPLDAAILFAPAGELVPEMLTALDKGGTLALAGIHMSDVPPLDYQRHLFFEKTLRSVTANTRDDGRDFLAEAARARVRPHVTTYPLAEANQALLDLKEDRLSGSGYLTMDQ